MVYVKKKICSVQMESSGTGESLANKQRKKPLDKLNLNHIHRKRRCHVILVVEKTANDLEKLLMIRYHSECDVKNELKFISLNDIYDFIISYEIKKLFIDDLMKFMLRKCCHEARVYLRQGSTIPHDLLARIIKLRIITIIMNDVHQHKYPMLYHEDFLEDFFELRKRNKLRSSKVKFKQLYIVLVQFYSPKIIPACCQCGLSISAIVEFGQKDDCFNNYLIEKVPSRQSDIFRQEFWKKAPRLYLQHHLEEPFRLVYNPRNFSVLKDKPKVYSEQCRSLYKGFLKSIDIEKIKKMKDTLIHRFGLHDLLMAEIAKENANEDVENKDSCESFRSISTDTGWEDSKPFVKRVSPELDIDSRKRFTKWPIDIY